MRCDEVEGISEEKAFALQQQMGAAFKSEPFQVMLKEKGHDFAQHDSWPADPEAAGAILQNKEVLKHLTTPQQNEFLFWENIKNNGWEVPTAATKGNPIGKRWDRAIRSPTEAGEALRMAYGKRADGADKAAFRKDWARKEYLKKSVTWTHLVKETREHWKKSVYIPLGRVAHFEGGGKAGWIQAIRFRESSRPHTH
eukprot:9469975-Pyramimonas_sp.AAC.2